MAWDHALVKARLAGDVGPRPWKDGDPRVHCTHCPSCHDLFRTEDISAHRPFCWADHAREDLTDALAEIERLTGGGQ